MLIDYDKRYDKVVDYGKRFVLGHNRWATTGKVSQRNAHPFAFDNILGCHNGTVPDYRLRELKKDYTNYGTDSEAVLACIDSEPLQDTFRTLSGAWAFVWYDRRDDTVNFLRNPDRYLCYCYSEDRETLFWASEAGFLSAALSRNKIKYGTIYEVTEGAHTCWKIPEGNKPFEKARQRKIISGEFNNNSSRFPMHSVINDDDQKTNVIGAPASHQAKASANIVNLTDLRTNSKQFPVKAFESSGNLNNFDNQGYIKKKGNKDFYRGYRGEVLSKTEFERLTKSGCVWCDDASIWGQPVRFLSTDTHMCLRCTRDDDVRMACGVKG